MNAQKLTQKSLEAIQAAQTLATEHAHMQIEQQHLLLALIGQSDGLIGQLLQKMGVDLPPCAGIPRRSWAASRR